ncbi:hypothetical protein [Amycolatopsis sp. GA6-003]|uniref:hypothetical protein n=1 Tax=Amycolatopsis sp. GA6-003 TaxID=2652444 RepID=UPI0039176010
MSEHSPEEKLRNKMLHDAGLAVVEASCSFDGPSPESVWKIVVRGDAIPDVRVNHESDVDEYLSEVDRA